MEGAYALGATVIDLETIEREINELEARGDTTYSLCERLAWLYVCRDHLRPSAVQATQELHGTEFLEACSNVPYHMLMKIIDEHMSAIKAVYPKEYESVMAKIYALR